MKSAISVQRCCNALMAFTLTFQPPLPLLYLLRGPNTTPPTPHPLDDYPPPPLTHTTPFDCGLCSSALAHAG